MSTDRALTFDEAVRALKAFYERGEHATIAMFVTAAPTASNRASMVPTPPDVVAARAQGRAEALALLLDIDTDTFCSEYIVDGGSLPSGDRNEGWDASRLKALFRADDTAYSLMQAAEGEYWSNLALREEADRNYALSKSVANTPVIEAARSLTTAYRDGALSAHHVSELELAIANQRYELLDSGANLAALPPTFEGKHVSLKQKGAKLFLTLELDGVEGAPSYLVTPVNPAVVRAEMKDSANPGENQ
ncbi:hypothetical protein [Burkholderia vietnamiensis]|uniref:hypothetical protein n=1 Tax=Burkholderia vietnamiensis TaxID=60552 RepID=UPI000623AD4D|nr:hypothetical protein [Burkholderia vietnamiensis]